MAYPQERRGTPLANVPGGPSAGQRLANQTIPHQQPAGPAPPQPQVQVPPENTYPCGCAWPGTHKPDCMWSLWEQMRDNYLQTRELMSKFMSQASTMQGDAMGLQGMTEQQQPTGVTLPWGFPQQQQQQPQPQPQSYSVESEARRQMEEQRRIKNTWVQFLNIFDMALDMANDVSKDRWEQNRRRKERQRLEREQRLEELRKERLERQRGSKPEPRPDKGKTADKKDVKPKENKVVVVRKDENTKETPKALTDKSKTPAENKPSTPEKDKPKTLEEENPKPSENETRKTIPEESVRVEPKDEPVARDEPAAQDEPIPDPTVNPTENTKEEGA